VIKEDVSAVSTKDVCGIFVNAGKELLVYFAGYCRVDNPITIPVELKHSPRHQLRESVPGIKGKSVEPLWLAQITLDHSVSGIPSSHSARVRQTFFLHQNLA